MLFDKIEKAKIHYGRKFKFMFWLFYYYFTENYFFFIKTKLTNPNIIEGDTG